jgi:hypothetical protein
MRSWFEIKQNCPPTHRDPLQWGADGKPARYIVVERMAQPAEAGGGGAGQLVSHPPGAAATTAVVPLATAAAAATAQTGRHVAARSSAQPSTPRAEAEVETQANMGA